MEIDGLDLSRIDDHNFVSFFFCPFPFQLLLLSDFLILLFAAHDCNPFVQTQLLQGFDLQS